MSDNALDHATKVYLKLLLDAGCKFLFQTEIAGKPYVWMKDAKGVIFLERLPEQPLEYSVGPTSVEEVK